MNEYALIEAALGDTSQAFNMLPNEERTKINMQTIKAYNEETNIEAKRDYADILISNNAAFLGKAMNRFFAKDTDTLQQNKSELFSVAVEGFLKGVSHFKEDSFNNLNYTLPYINHALMDQANFLKKKSKYEAGIERQIKSAKRKSQEKGVEENIYNLSQYTKASVGVIKKNYSNGEFTPTKFISIDETDEDTEGNDTILITDDVTPEDLFIQDEGTKIIRKALNVELNKEEIQILVYSFGLFGANEKSDLQISKAIKSSVTSMKQMRNKALVKLSYNQELREYFNYTQKELGYEPFSLDFITPQNGEDLFDYFETKEGQEYLKKEEEALKNAFGGNYE